MPDIPPQPAARRWVRRRPNHRPNEEIFLLPGFPGYRTQPGRSGYDYLDTQYELAHMTGIFLRRLFSFLRRLFTNTWLDRRTEPHALVTLFIGITLLLAFPGGWTVCPGIIIVLLIALVSAVRNGMRPKNDPALNK